MTHALVPASDLSLFSFASSQGVAPSCTAVSTRVTPRRGHGGRPDDRHHLRLHSLPSLSFVLLLTGLRIGWPMRMSPARAGLDVQIGFFSPSTNSGSEVGCMRSGKLRQVLDRRVAILHQRDQLVARRRGVHLLQGGDHRALHRHGLAAERVLRSSTPSAGAGGVTAVRSPAMTRFCARSGDQRQDDESNDPKTILTRRLLPVASGAATSATVTLGRGKHWHYATGRGLVNPYIQFPGRGTLALTTMLIDCCRSVSSCTSEIKPNRIFTALATRPTATRLPRAYAPASHHACAPPSERLGHRRRDADAPSPDPTGA